MIKMNKIDKYIISSALLIIIYTGIVITLTCLDKAVPSELTIAFFAAFGGEAWACAWIKKLKLKEGGGDE